MKMSYPVRKKIKTIGKYGKRKTTKGSKKYKRR